MNTVLKSPAQAADSERQNLTLDSRQLGLLEYWAEREVIEDPGHRSIAVPFVWHWKDLRPLLARASSIVPMKEAYRRALLFSNPGLKPKPWITTTIYGGCSWYNPGEAAEVHRHPPSASRFVLAGDGGWTAVQGEKCMMSRGDLILTPNGSWHDHGNDGREPVIWVDILDLPLVENLNNSWVMEYEYAEPDSTGRPVRRSAQSVRVPADYSSRVYGAGGIKPTFFEHARGDSRGSPMLVYRWKDTLAALSRLRELAPDPCDGISVEFVDPTTGGPVLATLSFGVHLHPPGFAADFQRKTASTVFCVIQGAGHTELGDGRTLQWEENDFFVVPSGTWYRHVSGDPKADLLLYAVSDEPTLRKLELLERERRDAAGAVSVR